MKTQEELNALKEETEAMSRKLAELTAEEMEQLSGGENELKICPYCGLYLPPYKPAAIKHLRRHLSQERGDWQ